MQQSGSRTRGQGSYWYDRHIGVPQGTPKLAQKWHTLVLKGEHKKE